MEIFIHKDGQDHGPYSPREVQERLADGRLQPSDYGYHEGATDWLPLFRIDAVNRTPFEEFALVPTGIGQVQRMPPPLPPVEARRCPFCAEVIQVAALKCRHCGESLDPRLRAVDEARRAGGQRQAAPHVSTVINITGQKIGFSHGIHFIITLLTAGLWLPMWFILYLFRDRQRYF